MRFLANHIFLVALKGVYIPQTSPRCQPCGPKSLWTELGLKQMGFPFLWGSHPIPSPPLSTFLLFHCLAMICWSSCGWSSEKETKALHPVLIRALHHHQTQLLLNSTCDFTDTQSSAGLSLPWAGSRLSAVLGGLSLPIPGLKSK